MAKSYSRNQIFRMARRYHFENYYSGRLGHGDRYRSYTLIALLVAVAGVLFTVRDWSRGPSGELFLAIVFAICGLAAAIRNAPEWYDYSMLAREFATVAADGKPATDGKDKIDPCMTLREIVDLFQASYPWLHYQFYD